MKSRALPKILLLSMITGIYTPYDLREFVRLCYNLALPLVRKKIVTGKLNLSSLRMPEQDVMYDCLADLFERDDNGTLIQIKQFFEREQIQVETCSEELLLDSLRRIVFNRVNTSLIRLFSEADPVLGKILHNIDVSLNRTNVLAKMMRFGENHLIPIHEDPLFHQHPMPFEYMRDKFSRIVLLHDTMPTMLRKMHAILVEQSEYQRTIPFVLAGSLFKQIYKLSEHSEYATNSGETIVENAFQLQAIDEVCQDLDKNFYQKYVTKKKTTEEDFRTYLIVIKKILYEEIAEDGTPTSLFDTLRLSLPILTRKEYQNQHRSILEYLLKDAKKRLRKKFSV